jgi:hypothetical protein
MNAKNIRNTPQNYTPFLVLNKTREIKFSRVINTPNLIHIVHANKQQTKVWIHSLFNSMLSKFNVIFRILLFTLHISLFIDFWLILYFEYSFRKVIIMNILNGCFYDVMMHRFWLLLNFINFTNPYTTKKQKISGSFIMAVVCFSLVLCLLQFQFYTFQSYLTFSLYLYW